MVRAFVLCYFNYCPLYCGISVAVSVQGIWNVCNFKHKHSSIMIYADLFRTTKAFGYVLLASTANSPTCSRNVSAVQWTRAKVCTQLAHHKRVYDSEERKSSWITIVQTTISMKEYTIGRNEKAIELPLCKQQDIGWTLHDIRVLNYYMELPWQYF